MNVTFVDPGADHMISRIMEFQAEGDTTFWSDPLFHFFPKLDKAHADSLPFSKRKEYMEHALREIYTEIEETISKKVFMYSQYWDVCKSQISDALSDAFGVDCSGLFNDLQCNVSMNPIEPRYLREHRFDIFYLNSERGAIGESIHEIIHFIYIPVSLI